MMDHRGDTANRITDITNGVDSAETWDFGYDALSRLVTAQSPASLGGFGYDAIGNRTSRSRTPRSRIPVPAAGCRPMPLAACYS